MGRPAKKIPAAKRQSGVLSMTYKPPPTIARFHVSGGFVRGVKGPIGSAKSTACCWEFFRQMITQKPGKNGKRCTRFGIVRNTYAELETTTLKTWLEWFPESVFGRCKTTTSPFVHHISFDMPDGIPIESEAWFVSMDRPSDVKKLLSFDLTSVWANEARELPLEGIYAMTDRVGRYPSQKERPKHISHDQWPTRYGLIMDTNAPEDEDHWWTYMSGDAPWPDNVNAPDEVMSYEFFSQPPAAFEKKDAQGNPRWELNPNAENLENLPANYYRGVISGKSHSWIRVMVCGKYGSISENQAVYEGDWSREAHLADTPLEAIHGIPIHVGLDGGRTPAACFSQRDAQGRWRDLHELVCKDMGATQFAELLVSDITEMFPDHDRDQFRFWCDPSMIYKGQNDDYSFADILMQKGIRVKACPISNEQKDLRREAGAICLRKLVLGKPAYQLSPTCPYLLRGFEGKFCYLRIGKTSPPRYSDKVYKNMYSHIHEARQYAYAGAGEVAAVAGRRKPGRFRSTMGIIKAKCNFNPLE